MLRPSQRPGSLSPTATHVNQLLLLLLRHLGQAVVSPLQVALQASQGVHHHPLHLPALCSCAGGGEAQPPDAAARPHPAGQHVALVKLRRVDLGAGKGETGASARQAETEPHLAGVQVGGVLHAAGVVAVVAFPDHRVHQLRKHLQQTEASGGEPGSRRGPRLPTPPTS